ncbi:hypothetical protein Moror_15145 [Moniliophthora roreri MCA 2997]|uniref:CCHC-type domain-containing protein n=1 Tax=Moniliophthora roreri (strain MCA 2997) TaxID=1381753 RepID=V2X2W5_MONRO|nr:hypothetical protein Moror_15145 [Moniliophthora roreri MCA 2997]
MNKTVKSTTALRPTYKPTLQNRNGSQTGPKTPKKVTAAHHPSRLVVRFLPNGVREEDKKKPEDLVHDINEAIASVYPLHPEYGGEPEKEEGKEGPRVVAAKYTDRNTSLILTVREDQSGEDLLKYFNFFKDHIIRDDSDYRLEAYSDKKWFKVQVDNVITIDTLGDVLNPNALLGELIQNNPIVQKLYESGHLTMKPRWTRPTEDLLQQERKRSSFVFVTDVEDAAIRIVRSGSLAMYGYHCEVRLFQDRPLVLQCVKCWRFGHAQKDCKNQQVCRKCGRNEHTEDQHGEDCSNCAAERESEGMDTLEKSNCHHALCCTNCHRAGLTEEV